MILNQKSEDRYQILEVRFFLYSVLCPLFSVIEEGLQWDNLW